MGFTTAGPTFSHHDPLTVLGNPLPTTATILVLSSGPSNPADARQTGGRGRRHDEYRTTDLLDHAIDMAVA
jgi:hypothetical protein